MPHATRPGDVLGDRYRLVDLLTESGDGRFWRAYDRVLERQVAVHVIRADDDRATALMAAARRSATVLDRRVLRVLDADVTDQVCYVVNEWGSGTSLDIVVAGGRPLAARLAAWLVAEVADSIAVAHAAGVAHGRLNPENVLVDRSGGIRLIGLGVDAALHGVALDDADGTDSPEALDRDLTDLAGLLYCGLTARWAGESASIVTAAPREHDVVLRPRQVRAGVPRPLDALCDEVLHRGHAGRHRELGDAAASARGMADFLAEHVGDDTGMPVALLAATPDVLPEEEQVVLPPVPEVLPHDDQPADTVSVPPTTVVPTPRGEDPPPLPRRIDPTVATVSPKPAHDAVPGPAEVEDRPTEAGVPIFGDGNDDVSWLERRTTPAPPPPPFDEPPVRPLFAPDPTDGSPVRRSRPGAAPGSPAGDDEYWPWDTSTGTGRTASGTALPAVDDEPVPGRRWLRLATVLAAVLLLVVAVLVAVNLDDDQSAAGGDPGSASPSTDDTSPRGPVIRGLTAAAFDPQTDGEENDLEAPNAVDGDPATGWSTSTYNDQLGPPPGLKTGVGLDVDLGREHELGQVALTLVGAPTRVSVYVTDETPTSVDGLQPVASATADGPRLTLDLDGVSGRHLVVWLTSLPPTDDGRFRATVAEVVVRGA